jgi:hypothetical protein
MFLPASQFRSYDQQNAIKAGQVTRFQNLDTEKHFVTGHESECNMDVCRDNGGTNTEHVS